MTQWNPVFVRSVSTHPYPFLPIDYSFQSSIIAIRVICQAAPPSWHRAGWFHPILQIAGPGIEEPFTGTRRRLYLGNQILRFDNLTLPYEGRFYPVGWLPDATVIAWEPDSVLDADVTSLLEEVKDLQEKVTGEELILRNGNYREVPDEPGLIESTFVESVPFDRYEAGRFKLIATEQTLSDPIIQMQPKRLIVIFTSNRRIEPGTVRVKITES